jgi:uncharacterized tellurite resistance protein B-like protein
MGMNVLPQLKLLINLARIDGDVAERERKYITNIGAANGMKASEVAPLFETDHEEIVPNDLSDNQKFSYIFSLVQLMKIDQRLYKDEIKYCSRVASRLGYNQDVMFELMVKVKSTAMHDNEVEALRELTSTYLSK